MMYWLMLLFKRFRPLRGSQALRVSILFSVLLLYAAAGYRYFEGRVTPDLSWADSVWWAIVTMTTVGYGDMFPTTTAGRFLVGFPTMLLGISILGYVLSVLAAAMIESRMKELKGMKQIEARNHVIICNYISQDRIAKLICEIHQDASTADAHVVVIDPVLDELPLALQSEHTHFVKGQPMRESVLATANTAEAKAIIIQADPDNPVSSDNENLRTALTLKEVAPDRFVCVECTNPENVVYFERAGCDSVVCIASLASQMVVQELQDPGVAAVVSDLTSNTLGNQFYILDIAANCTDFGRVREHYTNEKTLVIGLRRGRETLMLPAPSFPVEAGDRVVLIAATRPPTAPAAS